MILLVNQCKFIIHSTQAVNDTILGWIVVPLSNMAHAQAKERACQVLHLENVYIVAWEQSTDDERLLAEQRGEIK